ncbi:MAG: hypothetical protein IPH34_15725 [Chitinophagaceae bacterium]|nr:hypothetical protein [Chitinophagaceae bacterium]
MKSIPGTADAKENFTAAWESIVKEMVAVSGSPTLQPSATENGWVTQSGFANFTDEGRTGIALLATSTGYDKMVNIVTLTNTDTYQNEMNSFFESIDIRKPTSQTTTVVKKRRMIWARIINSEKMALHLQLPILMIAGQVLKKQIG